jgi:hypothetical protein
MSEWLIQEWPHSAALGERWVAVPPVTPPDKPWPGIRWFASEDEARKACDG